MSRWPNFFIVGASRSATTSLYLYLKAHPDIYLPNVKEPNFFAQVPTDGELQRSHIKSIEPFSHEENYLKLFEGAGSKPAVGEASVYYLYDEHAPQRIRQKIPEAKIIINLRNPVERAYSLYMHYAEHGLERKPFYEALMEDQRRPRKVLGHAYLYVDSGLYYHQVKRYLKHFDRKNIRIHLYEDFIHDTAELVRDVCGFLEVPHYNGRFFDPNSVHNISGIPRGAITARLMGAYHFQRCEQFLLQCGLPAGIRKFFRQLLLSSNSKSPIDPEAREYLQKCFREDILKLQDLIGRDLSAWLDQSSDGDLASA